jgi:CRP/FNR family transcriptional regulator, cyclic AMP receptor protein
MLQTARQHLRRPVAGSRVRPSSSPAAGLAPRPRLAGHRLFRNADAARVERCEGFFEVETLPRGTELFAQDDQVEHVYVVLCGYVRLSILLSDGREMSVGLIGPGEFIGEEALADAERRPFSATVVERCTIFRAHAAHLGALFRADVSLAMNLARHMSTRYAEMSAAFEDIAQGKVRDRLLRALKRIAAQCGGGQRIGVKLTHQEIATFVGSTRETVTVELAALMRAGAISRGPGCFTLLAPT